jgi:hypothetical protein
MQKINKSHFIQELAIRLKVTVSEAEKVLDIYLKLRSSQKVFPERKLVRYRL